MSEGQQPRYLIRDRDRSYGGAFIGKARAIGIKRRMRVPGRVSGWGCSARSSALIRTSVRPN